LSVGQCWQFKEARVCVHSLLRQIERLFGQGAACGVLPSGVPLRVPLVWFIASALRHTSRVVSTTEFREKWEGCLHLTALLNTLRTSHQRVVALASTSARLRGWGSSWSLTERQFLHRAH
jgi:hypothetical protein